MARTIKVLRTLTKEWVRLDVLEMMHVQDSGIPGCSALTLNQGGKWSLIIVAHSPEEIHKMTKEALQ